MRAPSAGGLVAVFALGLVGGIRAGDGGPFKVPGVLSIDTPGGGFEWKDVGPLEGRKISGHAFLCSKEGSDTRAALTLERRKADTEAKKVATLKAHYNTTGKYVQELGCTNILGTPPALQPPIPERVFYAISATDPDGKKIFIGTATIFGENTYCLQVFAPSLEEAQRIIRVATTLKEG